MNQNVTNYINRSNQWKEELTIVRALLLYRGLIDCTCGLSKRMPSCES
jgi:hypothetical protein